MKFGKNLPRNQVPEWSTYYLNYKSLKKQITNARSRAAAAAAATTTSTAGPDGPVKDSFLTPFFYSLDRNLETVDSFYNKRLAECSRRLKSLLDRFHHSGLKPEDFENDELEDLVAALLELRSQLRMLQWYAEVNRRGFIKILKKLDKKCHISEQQRYLDSKVFVLSFASGIEASQSMETINSWLSNLAPNELDHSSRSGTPNSQIKQYSSAADAPQPPGSHLYDLETIKAVVATDDIETLKVAIAESGEWLTQKVLLALLQKAISLKSLQSVEYLLTIVDNLTDLSDLRERNIFHRHVVALGRQHSSKPTATSLYITPAENPVSTAQLTAVYGSDGINSTDETAILRFIFNRLPESQRSALAAKDAYKRTTLHYASQYGMLKVTDIIIEYLIKWKIFDVAHGLDAAEWVDGEGFTPFHLAVIGNHPKTLKVLLNSNPHGVSPRNSSNLLNYAARSNYSNIIELLLDAGLDINYAEYQLGETALYVASRTGHVESVQVLLKHGANTEIAEATYGWTPLFAASVDGFLQIVELLIANGCDIDRTDGSGWTAMEHASLRGHLDIAKKFPSKQIPGSPVVANFDVTAAASASVESLASISSSSSSSKRSLSPGSSSIRKFSQEPIKSFGHRYLTSQSMILLTLGSTDTRSDVVPVQLEQVPFSQIHSTQLDTALSLVIWAQGATNEPTVIDLPIQDNQTTEPIVFYSDDPSKVKLFFDLVPTYAGNRQQILGRAVAILSSIQTSLGHSVRSLHQTITVPLVQATTLDILGTVNFEFLTATPFSHANIGIAKSSTYWKSLASSKVIGHRGLGKNSTSRKSLQLGENTLQSFIAAANLGASYVEFDVQLTKDRVPVIYHDFLVAETGIDVPMHALTLEQFLNVSERRNPKSKSRNASPRRNDSRNGSTISNTSSNSNNHNNNNNNNNNSNSNNYSETDVKPGRRPRSLSLEMEEELDLDFAERLKFTRTFKTKGFKGNSRGVSIQAPFTTLQEVLKTIPKNVGFNIECKYPMLDETQAEDMDDVAIDLNEWVDSVLKVVYDHADGRDIIFSSFHPDVCLMLSLKQPSIPVLFLTEAGTMQMADIRASSLQEAIRFASRWNLLGLVSACEPLILTPRLITAVKESGLVCFSYGVMNNVPSYCKLQMSYGLDAVIVDSVLAVRKGLTVEQ
ncbi:GDPD-domain-containing protein [Lipomyces japonicus]|uniref:GDPD-domain-containing protein n=1 Tax=Lipomyces japonicus TaxID=56871 RepID=UPI0034CD36D2